MVTFEVVHLESDYSLNVDVKVKFENRPKPSKAKGSQMPHVFVNIYNVYKLIYF